MTRKQSAKVYATGIFCLFWQSATLDMVVDWAGGAGSWSGLSLGSISFADYESDMRNGLTFMKRSSFSVVS